ncbi:MAG: polymer-forming cytoskeletal protein [Alphaproteobacteria bacterium]|nr:polymer-forming cytoskeletal protein [Alphaproteobacteria bacterium]
MLGTKSKTGHGAHSSGLSIIAADVVISGHVRSTGEVQIDGCVEGDVMCSTLSLGTSGRIKGHITAEQAKLGGEVDGSVSARDLTIDSAARISGDLSYTTVNIAAGAQVDGKMTHRTQDDTPALKLVTHDAG